MVGSKRVYSIKYSIVYKENEEKCGVVMDGVNVKEKPNHRGV